MDIKVIESGLNEVNEMVYVLLIDYGYDVKSIKLTKKELDRFSKKLSIIIDDI